MHTISDKHIFILDKVVALGNVQDNKIFGELYKMTTKKFPQIEVVTVDVGYKTPWIYKQILISEEYLLCPLKDPWLKKETYHDLNVCMMSIIIVCSVHKTTYFFIQLPAEKAIENIKIKVMNVYNGQSSQHALGLSCGKK